jgi:hypothetical protein
MNGNFGSIGPPQIRFIPLFCFMAEETLCGTRRYQRITLPMGMFVAWYSGEHQISRVLTLGMGGCSISVSDAPPLGAKLRLAFEVPGGSVKAEGVVRNIAPGKEMGVEFTHIAPRDRILLSRLLTRLLR